MNMLVLTLKNIDSAHIVESMHGAVAMVMNGLMLLIMSGRNHG